MCVKEIGGSLDVIYQHDILSPTRSHVPRWDTCSLEPTRAHPMPLEMLTDESIAPSLSVRNRVQCNTKGTITRVHRNTL